MNTEEQEEKKLDPMGDEFDLEKTQSAMRFNKKNMKLILFGLGAITMVGLIFGLGGSEKQKVAKKEKQESEYLEPKPAQSIEIRESDYQPRLVAKVEPVKPYEAPKEETVQPVVTSPMVMPEQPQDGRTSALYYDQAFQSGNQLQQQPVSSAGTGATISQPAPAFPNPYAQQNDQAGNQAFYQQGGYGNTSASYLQASAQAPRAYGYELKMGSTVPIVMVTGINSDLPGDIKAQVIMDIYDSVTGRNLLLPKGTTLVGNYNSSVAFGQERLMVAWQEIIRPDGVQLSLGGMSGVDQMGQAGISGSVDRHYDQIFKAAGLASMFDVGLNATKAALSNTKFLKNLEKFTESTDKDSTAETLTEQTRSIFNQYASKVINQQPTIVVEPGTRANLSINKTIILPPVGGF